MFGQIILALIFALNLVLVWITFFSKKGHGYRVIGAFLWVLLLLYIPLSNQFRFDILELHIVGWIVLVLGLILVFLAKGEFVKYKQKAHHPTKKLVTTGIYGKVRHPQYLGLMLFYIGWSLAIGALYAIYLIPAVIVLHWVQAYMEDKYILEKMFKKEYKKYEKKVGMFW